MIENLEIVAVIGTILGGIFAIVKHSERRLCKDIDEIKKEVKEIHEKVFHVFLFSFGDFSFLFLSQIKYYQWFFLAYNQKKKCRNKTLFKT